ncbi:hypothetical protein C1645_822606 [Glomus cerebriforme]|uniref:BTB/POZ domain-containing protein n=1 Tax=Glomus cerebriforme TaxID=658196 RepID=A0A397T7E8_9GLOM|nr:hypothetical protein C1645_822606 [Glomus cerebriforme]
MSSTKLFDRLSKDLLEILENSQNYDVVIKIGGEYSDPSSSYIKDENNNKELSFNNYFHENCCEMEFYVHSLLLSARSPYFRAALSNEWAKKDEKGIIVLKKPNIPPKVFKVILKYIYTGVIDFENQEITDILELLIASDELILDELIEYAQEYLIQNQPTWLQQNIVQVLHTIFRHDTCSKLQDYCLEIISNDPKFLFESEDYLSLDTQILVSLLERDDLEMDEIIIWDHLMRWGIAKTPSLPSYHEIENWSKEHFKQLEETLNPCIPSIRFFHISSDDYYKKVYPFKKILPKSLKKDIYGYFLSQGYNPKSVILPPRISPIDSIIITNKHASLIECWMQKKSDDHLQCVSNRLNNYTKRLEFNWKLLFRASRDGYSSSDFHLKCDNRGACVVIIKISGHDQVIGGFNPIGWYTSRYEYYSTSDSFIFSINFNNSLQQNSLNQENIKLCRVKDASRAIYQDPTRGPTFGYPDLSISDNCNENSRSNFEPKFHYLRNDINPIPGFYVDDYEIFQVFKHNILLFIILKFNN